MRLLLALLVLVSVGCDGCGDEETARRERATREGQPLASASQTDESVKPVYPTQVGEVPELVSRLCDALHGLPRRRRAECCETSPGVVLTSECTRNLTGALSDGSVRLEASAVAACEAAMQAAHAGCDWVGPWPVSTPPACRDLLRGIKKAGEACRSNLECGSGLRCAGVGPTDPGVCQKPAPAGGLCGAAVDTLAVYVRQDDFDRAHPACAEGWCDRNRCRPLLAEGETCKASVQCKAGRCVGGACVAKAIADVGERCSGGECRVGARCVAGFCRIPKAGGESCTSDAECRAACVEGTCQKRCVSAAIRRGLIKTHQP